MKRQELKAIYGGECYINAHGRKFYKKGILLTNVEDGKGNILFEKIKISKPKKVNELLQSGDKIVISAEVNDGLLQRVKIEEVYNFNV